MFKIWSISAIIFIALDMFWLGLIAKNIYAKNLGFLGKDGQISFNLPVGLLTQVIIITGIFLVLIKILNPSSSIQEAISWGALLGFTIYATYDLTNYSFVDKWPLSITIIDVLWGTFQGSIAGIIINALLKK